MLASALKANSTPTIGGRASGDAERLALYAQGDDPARRIDLPDCRERHLSPPPERETTADGQPDSFPFGHGALDPPDDAAPGVGDEEASYAPKKVAIDSDRGHVSERISWPRTPDLRQERAFVSRGPAAYHRFG
jgi:hypothetical protein